MCGIFFYKVKYNKVFDILNISKAFNSIKHRGPDYSHLVQVKDDNSFVGFHRLKINDLSDAGNQPFTNNFGDFLICNGEIYNHLYLEEKNYIKPKSKSDCEFLLSYFVKNITNIGKSFENIDGVFSIFASLSKSIMILGRDRYGVKPMFFSISDNHLAVASEAKAIDILGYRPQELTPGSYMSIDTDTNKILVYKEYYSLAMVPEYKFSEENILNNVKKLLTDSVIKRMMSDREVSCLLSGGLDSSIISSILSKEMNKQGKKLKTYSIGFPDSTDIKYARKVAEFIGSEHYEYIVSYEQALTYLPKIVKFCETYDITTIRASTPMFMLCEYISTFKNPVVFSGEGSDEVFAGYLYFHKSPSHEELNKESMRLIKNLYKYDVLRADRCTSGNGLDLREPFLDRDLIDFMSVLDPAFKSPKNGYEKYILRKAFDTLGEDGKAYLPDCVLWRRKAAFSDAVSSSEKPWYKYIQEHTEELYKKDENFAHTVDSITFPSKESAYYYHIFRETFSNYEPKIEYWLPKWNDSVGIEPSATALEFFDKKEH